MFPFWDVAIWPIVRAARARRIVEIGALRGETTALMLKDLGPDTELHVIDPAPAFDPAEHEREFPGRYLFYRDISHNVLPNLPAVDVALVDGDHNWYTVYNELRMLAAAAAREAAPLPVLILHDVCWPYGRRDQYYAPERIPEEFRQEHAQRGMRRGTKRLLPTGGTNPTMHNALDEGGARNGVMTALDDFVAEFDRPVRRLLLPVYYGLAIVVEEARLEAQPELASVLDRLESLEGKDDLLEVAETARLRALNLQHALFYHRERALERAAHRYLDLLGSALLNELYIDHEVRMRYLVECIRKEQRPNSAKLRDPVRMMRPEMDQLAAERRAGTKSSDWYEGSRLPYAEMGRTRLDHLEKCLDIVRTEPLGGDLVECGTGRGGAGIFMRGYLDAHEVATREVWVADQFTVSERWDDLLDVWADINTVRDAFERFGLLDKRVRFLQGPPADTLPDAPIERVALLRLGPGSHVDAVGALDALYDRLVTGGIVLIDDYDSPDRRRAIRKFRARNRIDAPIERIGWWGASWRKFAEADRHDSWGASLRKRLPTRAATSPEEPAHRAPIAAPAPVDAKDLSVVVVFYNMKREAARTLHSLSRAYQRGIDDLDYEVIVMENGSSPEERLGEEFVHSFGEEFHYVDVGDAALATPTDALNRGMALASGNAIAFMIDGAHVLTPGVLRYGMAGLRTYEPAIVATQQWYVGPGQQPDAMSAGYDKAYEDSLLEHIDWPVDGYRLFEIGHFVGERDWLDGLWESNCIFVPRALLEQIGGFDESFSMPSGGFANLDFYERMGATPGLNVVTILGEASFHQLHGGTTTNVPDPEERRATIGNFAIHYNLLRGRPFIGPDKTLHFVGSLFPSARRTRARRMTADAFVQVRATEGPDGYPSSPMPIPSDLQSNFLDAFWHSLAWRDTTWLGQRVSKAPTDLLAYQEIVERVRPDWIIETGSGDGGRALFFASICELLDHGRVISIDTKVSPERAEHPRITYIKGNAHSERVVERVTQMIGKQARALVVLGSDAASHMRVRAEFEAYHEFVPVGSYVIVENTIFNGHPVWSGHGPGPTEGIRLIMRGHENFAADPKMERFGVTFNPGGYLKRIG